MKRYPACILATACLPWRDEYSFAEDIFRRQVRLLRERLTPYIYIFGTAAEGHAVSERQFDAICRVFREETSDPDVHGMVGLISLSLTTVIERIERARDMGFKEFQISLPSWGTLKDDEVALFFRETCGRFPDCRFLHYNLLRTGRLITPREYGRLAAEYSNLVATKNSTDQMIRIRELLTLAPQIRHFITEIGYAYACQVGECGLLISISSVNLEMGKAYFEAGQRRDTQTLLDMQGELMALGADMHALVDERMHMDGGFDKLYCKMHNPEFPLRLLPPYRSSDDGEFQQFREMIRRKYPRWMARDLTPDLDATSSVRSATPCP